MEPSPKHLQRVCERIASLSEACHQLYPERADLTLEIGCGHGDFLVAYGNAHPQEHCLGIDIKGPRLEKAEKRRTRAQAGTVTFLKAEATELLAAMPGQIRLRRIFVLYPDPWPKRRHHKNRLIQADFLRELARHSPPGALLHFRTDHLGYFAWASRRVGGHPAWSLQLAAPWPFEQTTRFEARTGRRLSFTATRRADLG